MFIVNEMPKAVRDSDEQTSLIIVHLMVVTNLEHVFQRHICGTFLCYYCADTLPAPRNGASHFRQSGSNASDRALKFVDATPFTHFVRFTLDMKETKDC